MSICSSGASQVKPGVASTLILPAGLFTGVLLAISPWLFPFAALLDTLVYEAVSQCTGDPPSTPIFTPDDLIALVAGPVNSDFASALAKVNDVILIWAWGQYCQCTSGTTPAPSYPTQPSGTSVPVSGASCAVTTAAGLNQTFNSSGVGYITGKTPSPFPPGITSLTLTADNVVAIGPGWTLQLQQVSFHDAAGNTLQTLSPNINFTPGHSLSWSATCPPGSVIFDLVIESTTGSGVSQLQNTTWSWNCGDASNSPVNVCCPPDPVTTNTLNQILMVVNEIYSIIPVRIPNYVAGTVHSGLSGGGSLTLAASTIAVLVTITTLPVAYGEVIGNPDTYLDVGWLTPVNNEGPTAGVRISRASQTFSLPEATSSLDYSLPPTEVISITELQAG